MNWWSGEWVYLCFSVFLFLLDLSETAKAEALKILHESQPFGCAQWIRNCKAYSTACCFFVSPMVSYDQLWCYDPCLNHREMGTLWKWCPCKSNFVLFTIATAPNGSRRGEVLLIYNTRPFRIWINSIYYDMHYLYCLYCYVPIV